jgi:hypothetical protein
LLRLRTQCIAREPSARLDRPRKPYLIKAILKDQLGGRDGVIDVVDQPIWLTHDEASLEIARDITQGRASRHLPIVYISAIDQSRWLLDRHEIEKLAYDLGGVSHVIVEPDRAFSFKLRDITNGMNAYGGTLGIALPDQGIVRRVYLGWQLQSVLDLLTATRSICISLRSNLPAEGWDWTELQEEVLRRQRERDRNRLGAEEFEKLYLEEIDNLKDKIKQLEEQIISLATSEKTVQHRDQNLFGTLSERLGPEIYPGEFGDRLRLAAKLACADAERTGLDVRSRAVLAALVDKLPPSPALRELLEDLKRATKDFKRAASELTVLLQRHGFREKSDNKHIRLEAREGFIGLETITLPKTPSESRGLSNLRTQIERTLGITKLDK